MTCFCARCGEELTAPKFHAGKAYGYTCYEIVAGKKSRDKRKMVAVELVGELPDKAGPVRVTYAGRTYGLGTCYRDAEGNLRSSLAVFSDQGIFMVTHDAKGKSLWKNIK